MQIFELFGSILLKDDGVEDKIKKHDGAAGKLGKTFSGLGVAALAAGAALVAGFGAALISGIQGVMEGEDAIAQLDAVLKSTGGSAGVMRKDLLDMADQMQKTTKFTQEEVLAAESLLLTFTNIGEKTFPRATKAAADMATALGTDMAGQSIALGKALNDPTKGITALTRVGVTFTEEQKKSIKAMQESGDMAGAQTVILKELEKEFGGSAIAAGQTFSGQLEILKNAFGEVTEGLATKFMPYLQKFMDFVVVNMPTIENIFSVAFDVIGKAVKVVADFIADVLMPHFKALWDWIKPYMPQIKESVVVAFTIIKDIFKGASDFLITYVLPVYQKLLNWFITNFPKIKDAVMQAYNYIKPSFDKLVSTVKDSLMPILMGLWDTVKLAMPGIKVIFEIAFKVLVVVIKAVMDNITNMIKVVKTIYDFIKPSLDDVAELFSFVFGGIKKVIEGVQWVLEIFNGTKIKDKEATVTTNQVTNYSSKGSRGSIPYNASGTDFFEGGLSYVNELGGEIMDLPRGTRIIPHDVSMEMAKSGSGKGGITLSIDTFINNRKEDIEELAEELAFYMKKKELGGS
jgi:hypothetical protein